MKYKKTVVAIALLLSFFFIGSTIAYFTSGGQFTNVFKTTPYQTEFPLDVEITSDWLPGETQTAVVNVKNTSTITTAVRLSYTEEWKSNDGTILPNKIGEDSVAIINFANEEDWVKKGDYYYYQKELAANETSSNFIESVTLNPLLENANTCTTDENNVTSCTSNGTGYDNATYKINITVELVQADAVADVWNITLNN